jgi:GWxTD domain-containing protein
MFRLLFILLSGLFVLQHAAAQSRVSYVELLRSQRQSQIYFEHSFHASSDSLTEISVNFRIEHDYLTFTKGRDNTYKTEIKGSLEVYDKDGMVIRTSFWSAEKQVNSYEKTQVRDEFIVGRIHTELPKGSYFYMLKFQGGSQRREIMSEKVKFSINPEKAIWFYMLESPENEENALPKLINYGGNAVYGKNVQVGVSIAQSFLNKTKRPLSFELEQLDIVEKDTSFVKSIFKRSIPDSLLKNNTGIKMTSDDLPEVEINTSIQDFTSFFTKIENKAYPNAYYRIKISSGDSLIASKVYQSYWYDIPLSLLNLDVSISMLKFILPNEKIKQLFSGNEQKKLTSFSTFWKEKDPTPESDFNELMYEFYKRIDNAFKEYTTPGKPGFETDMGKIFIVYGPPVSKERALPSNGFVVETWHYKNRMFSFQATSGFGDFELIR